MTALPDTTTLDLELDNGWLTIWLATPENRNALSTELAADLRRTLEQVRDDRSVRGITLRGRGGIFCAGGDLKSFGSALSGDADHETIARMNRDGGDLFALVNSMPQVVIALVEGAAIAGGLGLMCCADLVVVMNEAKFSLTETRLGIVPAQIAPYIVRRAGEATARRLMLTGARFNGAQALDYGLADLACATEDEMQRRELELRQQVLKGAPAAIAATKEITLAVAEMNQTDLMDLAAERFATALLSDEGREGIASFLAKKKPSWAPEE